MSLVIYNVILVVSGHGQLVWCWWTKVDMAAMRSLMVASSVAFALACEDVNGFDQAPRLPDVMSDNIWHLQLLPVGCAWVPQSVSHSLDDPRWGSHWVSLLKLQGCVSVGTCIFQLDGPELGDVRFHSWQSPLWIPSQIPHKHQESQCHFPCQSCTIHGCRHCIPQWW